MKRIIKNYLAKKLNVARPKNYAFLRWLVGFVECKEDKENVLASIANWIYYGKHYGLPLTDLFVIDNTIYLYTMRPSLWIGKSGKTIDSCADSINYNIDGEKVHDYQIQIMEDVESPNVKINLYMRVYSDDYLY